MSWVRVTSGRPCPICGSDHWCSVSDDATVAYCMRVPSSWEHASGGWIHKLRPELKQRIANVFRKAAREPEAKKPPSYWHDIVVKSTEAGAGFRVFGLAEELGLTMDSLAQLLTGWYCESYTFPMFDGEGKLCGIRTRYLDGSKRAVKGSKNGIFIPMGTHRHSSDQLFICEGPTDTAAMVEMEFQVVGQSCALGGCEEVAKFISVQKRPVVIIADRDQAHKQRLKMLVKAIKPHALGIGLWTPPAKYKDVRSWYNAGGSRWQILESIKGE